MTKHCYLMTILEVSEGCGEYYTFLYIGPFSSHILIEHREDVKRRSTKANVYISEEWHILYCQQISAEIAAELKQNGIELYEPVEQVNTNLL